MRAVSQKNPCSFINAFSTAKPPSEAENIYNHMVSRAKDLSSNVESGIFAADMKVALVNDGPVTFLLKC